MANRSDIERVLAEHPQLHTGGYGPSRERSDLAAWRQEMFSDASAERILAACDWIEANLYSRKTVNTRHTSYGLKHIAEKHIGYITNGQFIAAMLVIGYKMGNPPGYNPSFNLSSRSVRAASALKRTAPFI
jgi:hypothetical protein